MSKKVSLVKRLKAASAILIPLVLSFGLTVLNGGRFFNPFR